MWNFATKKKKNMKMRDHKWKWVNSWKSGAKQPQHYWGILLGISGFDVALMSLVLLVMGALCDWQISMSFSIVVSAWPCVDAFSSVILSVAVWSAYYDGAIVFLRLGLGAKRCEGGGSNVRKAPATFRYLKSFSDFWRCSIPLMTK